MSLKNILITEDEPHMLRLLEFTLRKTHQNVLRSSSGEEALGLAESINLDLLVIDVGLPGMSGPDTVEAIKALPQHADLPVIMLTSRGDPDIKEQAVKLGVRAFLTKPFSPTELTRVALELVSS